MERQISCANVKPVLDYLRHVGVEDLMAFSRGLDPEIDALEAPLDFLNDANNWISSIVLVKLHQRVRIFMQDPRVAFKIARFAIESKSFGYLQQVVIKAFFSPKNGLKHIQRINEKFSRTKRVELVELGRNHAVVRLHWHPHLVTSKDICIYNQGMYAYFPTVWTKKPLEVNETCCYFQGARYCEYHLQWPLTYRLKEYLSRLFPSRTMLQEIIAEQENDKALIVKKYDEVSKLNLELNRKVKQLMAIQETGRAILSILDQQSLLKAIMGLLAETCEIHRALLMLVDEKEDCLVCLHAWGMDNEFPAWLKDYRVTLGHKRNLLSRVVSQRREEYLKEVRGTDLRQENFLIRDGSPIDIFALPLVTNEKVIGVIAIDAPSAQGVPRETRETLKIFAPHMAIAIENAKLYSRLKLQMLELQRSQNLLNRAEKFSFLGHLAAIIAHEIKNPLTAIGTFMQLLPRRLNDEEFLKEFHSVGMEEFDRINKLIAELLDLTRTKESHFELADPHNLIHKMARLLAPQAEGGNVCIQLDLAPEVEPFWMDTEKLKQVILNLLSNAVEFSPAGTAVAIKTHLQTDGHVEQRQFVVEVSDAGPGIEPALIGKIFDPYFTTKHKGSIRKGTGLGLFVAQKNIQEHGGTIDVASRLGQGTRFTVTIPAREQAPPPQDHLQ